MTKEALDQAAQEMPWDDQNWLFNRIFDRLWPEMAGKKWAIIEATGFFSDDDGYSDEDYEWYRKKAEEVERRLAEEAGREEDKENNDECNQ